MTMIEEFITDYKLLQKNGTSDVYLVEKCKKMVLRKKKSFESQGYNNEISFQVYETC